MDTACWPVWTVKRVYRNDLTSAAGWPRWARILLSQFLIRHNNVRLCAKTIYFKAKLHQTALRNLHYPSSPASSSSPISILFRKTWTVLVYTKRKNSGNRKVWNNKIFVYRIKYIWNHLISVINMTPTGFQIHRTYLLLWRAYFYYENLPGF